MLGLSLPRAEKGKQSKRRWQLDRIFEVCTCQFFDWFAFNFFFSLPTLWAVFLMQLDGLKAFLKTWFGFALRRWGLALGWPPSIKSLVNPRVHGPRLKACDVTGELVSWHFQCVNIEFWMWIKRKLSHSLNKLQASKQANSSKERPSDFEVVQN